MKSKIISASAIGIINYSVLVKCPNCEHELDLTADPYNDEGSEFSLAEDDLGLAVFGKTDTPAKWDGISIEYKCCACMDSFTLTGLEI